MILAGGHSRRMGKDKALLPLPSGQPLLTHTYEVAAQVASQVVIVTPWPARYRSVLPTSSVFVEEVFVEEPDPTAPYSKENHPPSRQKPSAGPLQGFAHGWQHISADWCLLLACDMPYLNADSLNRWWRQIVSNETARTQQAEMPKASLVATQWGWEPLCGFYHRSCVPSLLNYVNQRQANQQQSDQRQHNQLGAQRQPSFQSWLRTLPVESYTALPSKMLFNCNTPADWQALTGERIS